MRRTTALAALLLPILAIPLATCGRQGTGAGAFPAGDAPRDAIGGIRSASALGRAFAPGAPPIFPPVLRAAPRPAPASTADRAYAAAATPRRPATAHASALPQHPRTGEPQPEPQPEPRPEVQPEPQPEAGADPRPEPLGRPVRLERAGDPPRGPVEVRVLGDDLPVVQPGGVATVVVQIPVPPGADTDSLGYAFDAAPGFRPFFPLRGSVPVPAGERTVLLPLTVGVPASAAAGPATIGTLSVRTPGPGAAALRETIRIRVGKTERLEAELEASEPFVAPGGQAELVYRIRNLGNAPDTVALGLLISSDWAVRSLPPQVVLEPGETREGIFRIRSPEQALVGHEQSLTLTASGPESVERSTASLLVAEPDPSLLKGWTHLPTTVFVGSSTGPTSGLAASLQGQGLIAPATELSVALRHTESYLAAPAFRESLVGPKLRLAIRRPELELAVGEVQSTGSALSSAILSGQGLSGRYDPGDWSVDLHAGRPGGFGTTLDGHQVEGSVGRKTGIGHVGLTVADMRESTEWSSGYRSTGAGIGYRLPENEHHAFSLQAGVLSVRPDTGASAAGVSLDGKYTLQTDRTRLGIRGRLVPGTVARNSSLANELFANALHRLTPDLSLVGWGQLRHTPLLNSTYEPSVAAASIGTRASFGTARVDVGGAYRRLGMGSPGDDVVRTAAEIALHLPMGGLTLDADAEVGRFERATVTGPVQRLSAGVNWHSGAGWARVGARYDRSEYTDGVVLLDLSGTLDMGPARLSGGAASRLDGRDFADGVTFWSGLQVEARPGLDLMTGVDYQPGFGDDRWRFSLGASHRLSLPLPIPHPPALSGVVYEDRDGDRVRDPDEPRLPGVRIRLGRLDTRTGEDGRFAFRKSFGGAVSVDPASLPVGMAVPVDAILTPRGELNIPVVRAGAIEIRLFLDRNGDLRRDPGEQPAAETVVSLVDIRGIARDLQTDDTGRVRFGAVAPGTYQIRVFRRVTDQRTAAPLEITVEVTPGEVVEREIAVPARVRDIRMGGQTVDLGASRPD